MPLNDARFGLLGATSADDVERLYRANASGLIGVRAAIMDAALASQQRSVPKAVLIG